MTAEEAKIRELERKVILTEMRMEKWKSLAHRLVAALNDSPGGRWGAKDAAIDAFVAFKEKEKKSIKKR
jgi:hypothetical protein